MVPIQRKENHVSISSFHNEKIPSARTPRTYRRKRASLINSCHRRTKQTFFSKQLLVFLVTITLFRGSGDQCTSSRISGDSSYCCNSGTASIMLVSAASVAAAPATVDEDKKKRGKIKGVHAHPGGSVTPAGQRMQTIANGGGGSAKKREEAQRSFTSRQKRTEAQRSDPPRSAKKRAHGCLRSALLCK